MLTHRLKQHHKQAFTLIELIITLIMMTILLGAMYFSYLSCFTTFNASQDRSQSRTQLSQAADLITIDLYKAQNITVCNATTITFYADLGSGTPTTNSYSLSNNVLGRTTDGINYATVATNIQPQGTVVSWGTTPALFSCNNGLVTIDLTEVINGQTLHIVTNARTRNMPVGLAGWWRFDDMYPVVTGTCSTTLDYSGNGNIGTCSATSSAYPTWTTGNISGTNGVGALDFNASNNQNVTTNLLLNSNTFTRTAWINPASSQNTSIIGNDNGDFSGSSLWLNSNGTIYLHNCCPSSCNDVTSTSGSVSNSVWNFVAVSVNNGTATFYINTNSSVGSGTVQSCGTTLDIGQDGYGGGFFNGNIDDVRVYNRALSANEITQLYNTGI